MNSLFRRGLLSLCLLPTLVLASPLDPAAAKIMAGLRVTAPAQMDFVEVRFLHVMDQPLLSHGQLVWLGHDHLRRQVSTPVLEQVDIDGDDVSWQRAGRREPHFSLRHAPELRLLLQSFTAILSGDTTQLGDSFQWSVQMHAADRWTLKMQPRDETLSQSMQLITMDGQGQQLRCMRIDDKSGDYSIDVFGVGSTHLPAHVTPAVLQQVCEQGS